MIPCPSLNPTPTVMETTQVVMNYVVNGWPSDKDVVDELAREYFSYREELSAITLQV